MITELPLVPFVIINLTSLTAGVCMKVRFRSKVTRGFSFSPLRNSHSPLRGSLTRGKFKKNLWDQGNNSLSHNVKSSKCKRRISEGNGNLCTEQTARRKTKVNKYVTVNCLNMTTQRNLTTPLRYTAPQIKAVPSSSADTPRRKAAVKAD